MTGTALCAVVAKGYSGQLLLQMGTAGWIRNAMLVVWAALALTIVASAAQGIWSLYETYRRDYETYQQSSDQERRKSSEGIASRCTVFNAPSSIVQRCLAEQIAAYDEQGSHDQDLQAQRDMAFWSFWMVVIAAISLPISIGGVFLVWRSLHHTRAALLNDREVGRAQVRAYLAIDFGPPTNFTPGQVPNVDFRIVNKGQSPAYEVGYVALIELREHPLPDDTGPLLAFDPNGKAPPHTIHIGSDIRGEAKLDGNIDFVGFNSIQGNGQRRLYFIAKVRYLDVFKEEHTATICAYSEVTLGNAMINGKPTRGFILEWVLSHVQNEDT